jgi:hypothetical protein
MQSRTQSVETFIMIVSALAVMNLPTLKASQLATADVLPDEGLTRTSSQNITDDEIFSRLLEHNHQRDIELRQYSAVRTYMVTNDRGKVHAEAVVLIEYRAPGTKTFTTTSEEGSWIVRSMVFKRLMESEVETAAGRSHWDSSIKPKNYTFHLLGEDDVDGYHCFVVQAVPRRRDKYLFEGKVWINTQDFAIVKIAGHPAKNPSFWLKRVDFVRRYQKIGEFWLPLKDETITELKIHGKKILTIDHQDYTVNGSERGDGHTASNAGSLRATAPLMPISGYSSQEGNSEQSLLEPGTRSVKKE